ncbi:GvpL/GvpF family gas vesicle protein [Methylocystis bryophila]|uniref:Uncharacterized protein n=1 Tax=Methylocystis bryophila TaxID=655015 RepID=A0A1W6MXW1_9HYPH|nr:GvpL/GvpF family gas vesicle protein [Methylocystis bryophila]ARN82438.1 hypothetical protein B1812_16630 [Methylocystis bryophila]BDV38622.1 hypothetical protein DSM21852_18750 [Methylocystis bryophila]
MSAFIRQLSFDGGPHLPFRLGEDAIELFAFVDPRSMGRHPLPEEERQGRLMAHCVGSVAALIGFVCVAEYCGADSEGRFADAAWLAPRARRHAELIQWAMELSPVFPIPFGTLYSSFESLTTFMQAHEATIASFLDAAADNEEWELRATARLDAPILDQLACRAWPEWEGLPKGARYLRLCQNKSALAAFASAEAAAAASRLVAQLEPLTTSIQERSAAGSEFAARYALLVPRSSVIVLRERMTQAAAGLHSDAVVFSLSGPLPPFSFRPCLDSPPSRPLLA